MLNSRKVQASQLGCTPEVVKVQYFHYTKEATLSKCDSLQETGDFAQILQYKFCISAGSAKCILLSDAKLFSMPYFIGSIGGNVQHVPRTSLQEEHLNRFRSGNETIYKPIRHTIFSTKILAMLSGWVRQRFLVI